MAVPAPIAPNNERELVLARIMDASPEALYRTWTDGSTYPEWFCPKPWRAEAQTLDLRPGGASRITMHGPDGEVFPNDGVFLELTPGRKIVFTDAFTEGWVPNPEGMMTAVITFEPHAGGKTLLTARVGHPTLEKKTQHAEMGFEDGWGVMLDQLEAVARRLDTAA
ncbi:MAG: SRPBCC family protein [Phenylobacterium sp.]|uniref:SRPBCC family protein n=1 Tax=Phenylobacterium sp. TaxID=1871053 RepID=UPI001A3EE3E5|nr:SRPBCC family protein [Phenylobacterium sp.]MBL8770786.1 SRPBCC family protein [Phenylobacterium sp.]